MNAPDEVNVAQNSPVDRGTRSGQGPGGDREPVLSLRGIRKRFGAVEALTDASLDALYDGAAGLAGQIGHITVDEQGRICRCGNRGCLETLVGGASLLALLPPGWTSHTPDLHALVDAATQGDLGCRRIIADAGRAVGVAAAMLCNVLNPRRMVVGGELAEADDLLLNPLRETLARQTLPRAAALMDVIPAELGERAAALGAVALLERRLALHPAVE